MSGAPPKVLVAAGFPRFPDKLRKRERAGMASVMSMAEAAGAFSVSFDLKPKSVRAIVYLHNPSKSQSQSQSQDYGGADDDDDDDDLLSHDGRDGDAESVAGDVALSSSITRKRAATGQQQSQQSAKANKGAAPKTKAKGAESKAKAKAKQVDKNALSARGSPGSSPSSQPNTQEEPSRRPSRDVVMGNSSSIPGEVPSNSSKPRFKPWAEHMFKVLPGPPPKDYGLRGGKWVEARAAAIDYGNPHRQIWMPSAGRKYYEADDGDHVSGNG